MASKIRLGAGSIIDFKEFKFNEISGAKLHSCDFELIAGSCEPCANPSTKNPPSLLQQLALGASFHLLIHLSKTSQSNCFAE